MRIAICKEWLDPHSGFTKHILEVSKRLAQQHGYQFDIITSKLLETVPEYPGVKVHVVGGHPYLFTHTEKEKIQTILDEVQPDLLDHHGGPGTLLLTKNFDVPKIFSLHAGKLMWRDYRYVGLKNFVQERKKLWGPGHLMNVNLSFKRIARKIRRRNAFGLSVPTKAMQQTLQAQLDCPVYHLPSGVDVNQFTPKQLNPEDLGFGADEKLILFFGKAQLIRGIGTLLEAFTLVQQVVPNARLVLLVRADVSTGRVTEKVNQHPLKQFIYHEVKTRGDIADYLAVSHVVVLPFLTPMALPAQPLTLVEAMAVGRPSISTTLDVVHDLIEHEEHGLLAPPNRPDMLAKHIIHMLKDPKDAKRMGQNGRERILKAYDWDNIASSTHQFYQQAAELAGRSL